MKARRLAPPHQGPESNRVARSVCTKTFYPCGWRGGRICLIGVVLSAAFLLARPAAAQPINAPNVLWFDLDVDLAAGTRVEGEWKSWDALWRGRLGLSLLTPHWILTAGATAHLIGVDAVARNVALGGQLEAIHIKSGLSGYMGGHAYLDGRVGATFGVGWSILYVEAEALPQGASRLFFKLRVPLSLAAFALWEKLLLAKRWRAHAGTRGKKR